MEDPVAAMKDLTAADQAANPAPLGISRKFSIEYGLDWVFQWVWIVFRLGFPVSFD